MQRSDERERAVDDLPTELGEQTERDADARSARSDKRSGRAVATDGGGRLGRLFSLRAFFATLVLAVVGMLGGSVIPFLGLLGQLFGLLVAGFAVGLFASRRHYLEVGLAGAFAAGAGFLLSAFTSVFLPFAVNLLADYGVAIAGVGAGVGALATLVGHYFGRDLRGGLTREL